MITKIIEVLGFLALAVAAIYCFIDGDRDGGFMYGVLASLQSITLNLKYPNGTTIP